MIADSFKRALGLHPAGQEILQATQAEEARTADRQAALGQLAEVEAMEAELEALLGARDKAEKKLEATQAKAADARREVVQAQKALSGATQAAARRRRRVENVLRATAPRLVAENGPVLPWLIRQREHVGNHTVLATEAARMRAVLRDFERAGKPRVDEDVVKKVERTLEAHDAATEILPAFVDAIELVRELQLQEADDLPAAVQEILDDLIPERCACGEPFDLTAALPTDLALVSA